VATLFSKALKCLKHEIDKKKVDQSAYVIDNTLPDFTSCVKIKCMPHPSKQFPSFPFKTQLSLGTLLS
jgi:hypothetical protein